MRNYYCSLESGIALITSFFINVAIVATFAAQFFAEDCATNTDAAAPFSCMKIEDVRVMEDRNFNLITALKEDAEEDDFDEDARAAEASPNYENTYFTG